MNESVVTKIQNGKIVLPRQFQRKYGNAKVIFFPAAEGSFYMKPLEAPVPPWEYLKPKLKKIGKLLSDKDIANAVAWARKKVYKSRPGH